MARRKSCAGRHDAGRRWNSEGGGVAQRSGAGRSRAPSNRRRHWTPPPGGPRVVLGPRRMAGATDSAGATMTPDTLNWSRPALVDLTAFWELLGTKRRIRVRRRHDRKLLRHIVPLRLKAVLSRLALAGPVGPFPLRKRGATTGVEHRRPDCSQRSARRQQRMRTPLMPSNHPKTWKTQSPLIIPISQWGIHPSHP